MLIPKRTKYRKAFKGRISGLENRGISLHYGSFGLKALEPCRLTSAQIESARRAIMRCIRRVGKVWIKVFPDLPVSSKPAEVRMGSGKGSVEYWAVRIRPGRILFELDGMSRELAIEACQLAASKLPIAAKFIERLI